MAPRDRTDQTRVAKDLRPEPDVEEDKEVEVDIKKPEEGAALRETVEDVAAEVKAERDLEGGERGKRKAQSHAESVAVLKRLNEVGYGIDEELKLDLVFNPLGPVLPPAQSELEDTYRRELKARYGIEFTRLITITNLPLGRFLDDMRRKDEDARYWRLVKESFNAQTIEGLMCRHQLHVGFDGTMYDCDFNYALGMPVAGEPGTHIRDFAPETFVRRCIAVGEHCYGCTAGQGSSCAGALV